MNAYFIDAPFQSLHLTARVSAAAACSGAAVRFIALLGDRCRHPLSDRGSLRHRPMSTASWSRRTPSRNPHEGTAKGTQRVVNFHGKLLAEHGALHDADAGHLAQSLVYQLR